MYCDNDLHMFQGQDSLSCMCGYFRNGKAEKSQRWLGVVHALCQSPVKRSAEEIAELADSLEAKSYIFLRPK